MSAKAQNSDNSQNPPQDQIQQDQAANQQASNTPATEQTDAEKIAAAAAAVKQANPALSSDEIADIVAKVLRINQPAVAVVDKQTDSVLKKVDSTYKDKVFLKKDTKKQFPLERDALNGVVVRQTYKRTTEEGDDVTVPARNLNEIAIYSKEDFDRLNHGDKKLPGFAREGIQIEVWHRPGDEDTIQE
ncbi:hypothetical protein WBJ53_26065 [Spirosoma sp. SC4-14]|uniref:hypothetical protein n=1 Tax=Spirosoma sp. SC4-14 TaxID=3128900 RepID=UPI0030CC9772